MKSSKSREVLSSKECYIAPYVISKHARHAEYKDEYAVYDGGLLSEMPNISTVNEMMFSIRQ